MRPTRLNILQVVHDFLPRHRAGSEIYVARLAHALAKWHDVTVLCAEYDPSQVHGSVRWRLYEGLPVVEIVNNWVGRSFEDTYRPPVITDRIDQTLQVIQPDIVHVHHLFNLSFDLPALARVKGIPVVVTLHDHGLVCPSGGQRVHRAEGHVCESIDTERCTRCFKESPFSTQASLGALANAAPNGFVRRLAATAQRRFPRAMKRAAATARQVAAIPVDREAINARLVRAQSLMHAVNLFVSPSTAMTEAFTRLGVDPARIRTSLNGHAAMTPVPVNRPRAPLRIGFVGTLVWHKGVHVLLDAVQPLPRSKYEVRVYGGLDVAPDYADSLRAQAAGFPVQFGGAFEPARAAEIYAEIDVLVVPSLWPENAPLVIQEAFQAGVPVVAANMGGIPEFIREGVDGRLFNPRRPAELTAILGELIDRPESLQLMAASRPAVKTIEEDAKDWEERYRLLLADQAMTEKAS